MTRASNLNFRIRALLETLEPQLDSYSDPTNWINDLRKYYNEKYFDNKLREIPLIWMRTVPVAQMRTYAYYRPVHGGEIHISKHLLRNLDELQETLLHEMCHQATREISKSYEESHGPVWRDWMIKCELNPNATSSVRLSTAEEDKSRQNYMMDKIRSYRNQPRLETANVGDCAVYMTPTGGRTTLYRMAKEVDNSADRVYYVTKSGNNIRFGLVNKAALRVANPKQEMEAKKRIPDRLVDAVNKYVLALDKSGGKITDEVVDTYDRLREWRII